MRASPSEASDGEWIPGDLAELMSETHTEAQILCMASDFFCTGR
jgi:hypothetical protein